MRDETGLLKTEGLFLIHFKTLHFISFIDLLDDVHVISVMEARRSLVGRPVFKTGVGGEKLPGWVRFPCASATFTIQFKQLQDPTAKLSLLTGTIPTRSQP